MRVRFWGTRGSIATPGPGTNHFGGNTSCVELTTASGDLLIFDCGTGAHRLAADLMAAGQEDHRREHSPRTHALGSHSGLSVLQPGLRQRELRRDLWPGRQPRLAARRAGRPDGVHLLSRRVEPAAGRDHLPRPDRGHPHDRRRARRDAISQSPGHDARATASKPTAWRWCTWWITSRSPTSSGAPVPSRATSSPSCTTETAGTPDSWPTPIS